MCYVLLEGPVMSAALEAGTPGTDTNSTQPAKRPRNDGRAAAR